jgi:hypothetical protein
MDDTLYFESRTGKLTCPIEDVFNFMTDIRNFEQFIPQGTISNWQAEKESCSFSVSMLGTVNFMIAEKEMYKKVVINGDALKKNDFSIVLQISNNGINLAEVKVSLKAELNPMMKMMAANPISRFLEMLIYEMENFNGWKDSKV